MGKTSVLYAIGRRCEQDQLAGFLYQDMSFPGLYEPRWRTVLQQFVRATVQSLPADRQPGGIQAMKLDYSEERAPYHFRNDMLKLLKVMPNGRFWLALDEIENITFDLSPMTHWPSISAFLAHVARFPSRDYGPVLLPRRRSESAHP